jgi:hypothetical protein
MEAADAQDWISVRKTDYNNIEAALALGRLQTAGIEARIYKDVIGGWLGRDTANFVQVRRKDYEAAQELLNES